MKRFYIAIVIFFVAHTIVTAQWVQKTHYYFSGVYFVSPSVGWAVGGENITNKSNVIMKTTDGGNHWFNQVATQANFLYSVYFLDSSNGWASGWGGTLLKTTDGGDHWILQPSSNPYGSLYHVFFMDKDTGWILNNNYSSVMKTTNGGTEWMEYSTGTWYWLASMCFVNSNVGWVSGDGGTIRKTTDGGKTWVGQTSGTSFTLSSIYFIDSLSGWAVGGLYDTTHSVIVKTTDGGVTWNPQTSPIQRHIGKVHFFDKLNGYAIGWGETLLNTTDGGTSWISTPFLNDRHSFSDMCFVPIGGCQYSSWIVGENLTVFNATITISCTEVQEIDDKVPHEFKVSQNYPNPFNPNTTIEYQVAKQGNIEIGIYDINGRLVKSLLNATQHAGSYTILWNGQNDNGSVVSSGTYFYQVKSDGVQLVKKMLLLK